MSVIVISVPKSGTYLCQNLLGEFGMNKLNLHLSDGYYHLYTGDIADCRANPNSYKHTSSWTNSLSLITPNSVALTHTAYTPQRAQQFEPYKLILLTRDAESRKASWKRWHKVRPSGNIQDDKHILAWRSANPFELCFADMINHNVERLDQLQQYLFGNRRVDSADAIQRAIATDSLTKVTHEQTINHKTV